MKRTIVLLAFNIVISLVAIVPLSMVGFVFELAGFPEIQISDITTTIGMAIATALTIHYGYETYLGENGATLSGGQKQRIAIARALYREPEILILDEATSSLDSIAESLVQNAVNHLKEQGKTIIVIAHRLSTVVNADRLIVLDGGKVVEQGMPNELRQQEGFFRRMLQNQGIGE